MRIDILTLFPEMCDAVLGESIIGRARALGKVDIRFHQIRDFAINRRGQVDDTPYGGGAGMLMQAQPIYDCYQAIKSRISDGSLAAHTSGTSASCAHGDGHGKTSVCQ